LTHISTLTIVALLYIAYASTWVGYGIWNYLLRKYSVTIVTPFTLLVPVFGMISSIIFLEEHFESWKAITSLFIITGLSVTLLGPKIYKFYSPNKIGFDDNI